MYSRFCENYREFAQTKKATMHIHRKPGEVIEVDWAGTTLPVIDSLSGEVSEASIFVGVLPSGQYGYVEAFLSRNEEAWITAHNHMYHYFGGVSKLLVPDNLKTGVLKHTSEEVVLNKTYQEMAEHYGTVILPARVRATKDKPSVEMSDSVITTWIIASLRNTGSSAYPRSMKRFGKRPKSTTPNLSKRKKAAEEVSSLKKKKRSCFRCRPIRTSYLPGKSQPYSSIIA